MPTIVDNPEQARFELHTADGAVPGMLEYQVTDGTMAMLHTRVDPEFEGRGYGSTLVHAALRAARQRRLSVLPHCWFVRDAIAKQPQDYLDLVPVEDRPAFQL